jgi:hypothetical protein
VQRHVQAPPTRFAPTKPTRLPALSGRAVPPPPTQFGPLTPQMQMKSDVVWKAARTVAPPTRLPPASSANRTMFTALPGRAVPPPPTRFGPLTPRIQMKSDLVWNAARAVPAPTRLPPSSSANPTRLAALRGRAVPPPSSRYAAASPLQAKAAWPNSGGHPRVIQRHIIFNSIARRFESNGVRPGTHLSRPTIQKIIEDLVTNGNRNQAEVDFAAEVVSEAGANGYSTTWSIANAPTLATVVLQFKILSTHGFAVCHKVPYSAFESLVLACIQDFLTQPQPSVNNNSFKTYLNNTLGGHDGWNKIQKALQKGDTNAVEYYSRELCDAFDGNHNNLFIGYKVTNSSVSNYADLHWDTLGAGKATASPRGDQWLTDTQQVETDFFGAQRTESYMETDTAGDRWVLYSGVYGTKKSGTGFAEIF